MTAPQSPPMRPKNLLLRVYSVRRTSEESKPQEPTEQTWEVRAETPGNTYGMGARKVSLFYTETNSCELPPVDSLIHIVIDDELTVAKLTATEPVPTGNANPNASLAEKRG